MSRKKGDSRFLMSIAAIIVFYIALSFAFYLDLINTYIVIGALMLVLILTMIVLWRYRNEKSKVNKITWIFALVALLLIFDAFLIPYENYTYEAVFHAEPVEAAADSGINLMGVGVWNIKSVEDKEQLVADFESGSWGLIALNDVDNKERYHSRNNNLLQFLGFRRDAGSVMAKNVENYLGDTTDGVGKYLAREDIEGNSAGLALALTGLIERNKLVNDLEFGVTGALNEDGDVDHIGMVKEKLMIAEEKQYPFMIVPNENADEAEKAKEAQNLAIEIFAVSHIDEAVELINRLNEEHAE
ncbi:S16 family serine protease [Planococcus sp. X10-3]|uniref:S16 family serine protease n=1 Tax=Planococcus sp. X10-3 TaxID=3061240 RepID=UPI003BB0A11C